MRKSMCLALLILMSTTSPAWAETPTQQEQDEFAAELKKDWGWSADTRVRVVTPTEEVDALELERIGLAKFKGLSERPWVAFVTSHYTVFARKNDSGVGVLIIDRKTGQVVSRAASSENAVLTARFQELTKRAPAELVMGLALSKEGTSASVLRVHSLTRPKAGASPVLSKFILERQSSACPQVVTTQSASVPDTSALPSFESAGLTSMVLAPTGESLAVTQYHYLWLPEGADSKTCKLHGPSVTRKTCFLGKGTSRLLCGQEVEAKGIVTLTREELEAAKPFLVENKKSLKARGFRLVRPKE